LIEKAKLQNQCGSGWNKTPKSYIKFQIKLHQEERSKRENTRLQDFNQAISVGKNEELKHKFLS